MFKKFNIFIPLLIIATVAATFRLVNIATYRHQTTDKIGVISQAGAEENSPAHGADPPLSKEDIEKGIHDTANALKDGAKSAPAKEPVPPPINDVTQRAFSTSEIEVLQSLSKRRDELDKREKSIAQKEALLAAAGQEVDRKIAELNKLKGEMEALIGKQKTLEDERLMSLVKIYEGMKPKDAATIFNTLDLEVLLPVVSHMKESKTAPILATMDTEKAKIVTTSLAEQRKLPESKKDTAQP